MALNKKGANVLTKLGQQAFSDMKDEDPEGKTVLIPLNQIDENEDNASVFSMTEIELLAEDIKKYGFRGAIEVIKKDDGRYEILSGHRRYRAMCALAKEDHDRYGKIRAFIRKLDPSKGIERDKIEELLLSNMRNRDITPMQKSRAIQLYFDKVLDVYYPTETLTQKTQRACDFFGLKADTIQRLRSFQTLNPRLQVRYCDMDGFPVHGLVGTKKMTEEEISLLIDRIESVPGFQQYKRGEDTCPISVRGLRTIVKEVSDYPVIKTMPSYDDYESDNDDPVEDIAAPEELDTTDEPLDFPEEPEQLSKEKKTAVKTDKNVSRQTEKSLEEVEEEPVETLEVADNDKPEDLKPKVSVVKERLETGYYSMK